MCSSDLLEQARQERRLVVSRDGTVERAELTEPFAALMAPELTGQCATPRETGVTPPQATGDETDQMHANEDTNAVARTAVGEFGEFRDATHAMTESESAVTQGDDAFIAHGVNKTNLVGAAGFEPATARV